MNDESKSVRLTCLSGRLLSAGCSHSIRRASLIFSWKLVGAESKMEKQPSEHRFLHYLSSWQQC